MVTVAYQPGAGLGREEDQEEGVSFCGRRTGAGAKGQSVEAQGQ